MSVALRCAWMAALAAAPVWAAQAVRARRRIPRLPEAAGPQEGGAGDMRIVFLGESTVAGVGVGTQEEGLPGQTCAALGQALGRPLSWLAVGRNGMTVARARRDLVPRLPAAPPAVLLVALGVGDVIRFTPLRAFRRHVAGLLAALRAYTPGLLVLAAVPPLQIFPSLPQPLRATLGLRARLLDLEMRRQAAATPRCLHVPMDLDVQDPALMAADGFHPSARGYRAWGRTLAAAIAAQPLVTTA